MFCRIPSNQCSKGTFDKVMTTKLVQWAKQCTLMVNGTTLFLNCVVTPIRWPWKTLNPSQPMFTNFQASSSTPKPPKSSIHLTIKEKMLSEVADKLIASTHRRMGMCFHFCTTYKWIDYHCVLSIVVTSSALITMKGATTNATLVASNNTMCMTSTSPHPDVSNQGFLETLLTFKS